MADKKISQLTAASTPLGATDVLPLVQSGTTVKASVANVQAAPVDAGTANGVQYLNTSKVPSTTSTFVFNGTNFGLGTGSPLSKVSIAGGTLSVTGDAEDKGVLKLGDNTTATPYVGVYRGALGSLNAGNYLNLGGFDGVAITAQTGQLGAQARRLTILSSTGNVTVDTGNLVIGTAGKGIDFSANTHAAGMTSELLTWYEEGTWTATISDGTTDATMNSGRRVGRYTRVGRQVTVTNYVATTSMTGVTGNLRIKGLPFTVGNSTVVGGAVGYCDSSMTFIAGNVMTLQTQDGLDYIVIRYWNGVNGTVNMPGTLWGSLGEIGFTLTYFV